jgi:hypothetical protein
MKYNKDLTEEEMKEFSKLTSEEQDQVLKELSKIAYEKIDILYQKEDIPFYLKVKLHIVYWNLKYVDIRRKISGWFEND